MERSECPSEDRLGLYLRREQSEAEIARIEEHLVVCRACRLTLLGRQASPADAVEGFRMPAKIRQKVGRLPHRQSSTTPSGLPAWGPRSLLARWPQAPAFAIAALLLIVITAGGLWRFTHKTEPQNANSEGLRADRKRQISLRTVSPAENAIVPAPTIEFKWTREADALRYTVVVLDESGDIVHQAETTANSLLVDTGRAGLQSEKKYFWRVRAKLADGTEAETAPAGFYINPK